MLIHYNPIFIYDEFISYSIHDELVQLLFFHAQSIIQHNHENTKD